MNSEIPSSPLSHPFSWKPAARRLAAAAAVLALAALAPALHAQTTYYWSATGLGAPDNPAQTVRLQKYDTIILDASTGARAGDTFAGYTPYSAIVPTTTQAAAAGYPSYVGYTLGDVTLNYSFTPYADLAKYIDPALMPVFFTQSDPVNIAGTIKQDNTQTDPAFQAVTSNPYGIWPLYLYSSDALNPLSGAPRADMQNAAWVILQSSGSNPGSRTQIMDYWGDYSLPPAGSTDYVGNFSQITLEHVIFMNGVSSNDGGGINLERTNSNSGEASMHAGNRATADITGDVAFINNVAPREGGGVMAQDSVQFEGNAYFIGNWAGAQWNVAEQMFIFNTGGGSNYFGNGGAIRVHSGAQNANFEKDAIFIGNLAADMGGAISIYNNSTMNFYGRAVFLGNMGGLYFTPSNSSGNGGAIAMTDGTLKINFYNDAYFIANQASGFGGAIGWGHSNANSYVTFAAGVSALFSDNISGWNPWVTSVFSNTAANAIGGVFTPPFDPDLRASGSYVNGEWVGTTTVGMFTGTDLVTGTQGYGAKIRGGGAITFGGAYLLVNKGATVDFLRNSTNGEGGALDFQSPATATPTGGLGAAAADFLGDTSFIGNVAAINGGAMIAGTYGAANSAAWAWTGSNISCAAVYFGMTGSGSLLTVAGNIAYSAAYAGVPIVASDGAVLYQTGTAPYITTTSATTGLIKLYGGGGFFDIGGLYIESMYSFTQNQTGGSGGGMLIGSGTTPGAANMWHNTPFSLVVDPLDWKRAGTYSQAQNYALMQDNAAMWDGGAIAALDGANLYIGSGAKFINNYAGGNGGAIAIGLASSATIGMGTSGSAAPELDLRARTADIIFSGNKAGVSINPDTFDPSLILDPSLTTKTSLSGSGYLTVDTTTGHPNDIYVSTGMLNTSSPTISGTINMDAFDGMKIYLNGGIAMDNSKQQNLILNINTNGDSPMSAVANSGTVTWYYMSNTNPIGLVWFDNASADINGITTVGSGTLRISGTAPGLFWGSSTNTTRDGSQFNLGGAATLEANATINANTINLASGATLRVLNGGTLTLNAGAGNVVVSGGLNLAGNGNLNLGVASLTGAQLASITVGDFGHASAQILTLGNNAGSLLNLDLAGATLNVGLFSGNTSDKFVAGSIALTGSNTINLTSLAQASSDVIATGNGGITGTPVLGLEWKGVSLANFDSRMTARSASVVGSNIQLDYATTNQVLTWAGVSGSSLTATSGNMTGGSDTNYVLGDVITFGPGSSFVSVDENIGLSGMSVTNGYIFSGSYGITTQASAWGGGAAPASADGRLAVNAANQTVWLYNGLQWTDTGTGMSVNLSQQTGQANDFTGGILIQSGTLAVAGVPQLGTTFSQITFDNKTDDGATLRFDTAIMLDAAASFAPQRLDIASGNYATIATAASGTLTVLNNTITGATGGVFNVGSGATLNLEAQGNMIFQNNVAPNGGAVALADNATLNANVAAGHEVMFGLDSNPSLRTWANTSPSDSIYGTASSVINKTGAGVISFNSYSPNFSGALNVNEGAVMFGGGGLFGSLDSNVNIAAGAIVGGAGTLGGNLTVNSGGEVSIDASGANFLNRAPETATQTLTVNGNLTLNDAFLNLNLFLNSSGSLTGDNFAVGSAAITGITTINFNNIITGSYALVSSASTVISLPMLPEGTLGITDAETGSLKPGTETTYYISSDTVWPTTDFVVMKGGVTADPGRYTTGVAYDFLGYLTDTDADGNVFASDTMMYDTTKLMVTAIVRNQKIYWSGTTVSVTATTTGTWNTSAQDWLVTNSVDKTFAGGDSIMFVDDGYTFSSTNLITGDVSIVTVPDTPAHDIGIDSAGVYVADMTFTGTGNWTFTGGIIRSDAGANNYKDGDGNDLSTGQLLLAPDFTGTVTLANSAIAFNGVYVTTANGSLTKLRNVDIENGTLVGTAAILSGNTVQNNSLLVLSENRNETLSGATIFGYGTGDIIQTGTSTMSLAQNGVIYTRNYTLQAGTLNMGSYISNINASGTFTSEPGAYVSSTLTSSGSAFAAGGALVMPAVGRATVASGSGGLTVGTFVNNGLLSVRAASSATFNVTPSINTATQIFPAVGSNIMFIQGNYHSDGGILYLTTYRNEVQMDNVVVQGNSSGTSFVILHNMISTLTSDGTNTGTYAFPAGAPISRSPIAVPHRDTPIFTTMGSQRDMHLVMLWNDPDTPVMWGNTPLVSCIASATAGALVPVTQTAISTVVASSTVTQIWTGATLVSSATASGSTTQTNSTTQVPYYDANGNIIARVATGTTFTPSGTVTTTGTMIVDGTTTVQTITVVTGTRVVISSTFGATDIDYTESRDNYLLVEGKNGNWYLRNGTIGLQDIDLPMIAVAPVMADMLATANTRAIYGHINARHDALEKGWSTWFNYTHSEDRLRKEYYNGTMIKQDLFQVGADYAFAQESARDFSFDPSVSVGGVFSYDNAKATRLDNSTLDASVSTLSAYASARWWRLYLDMVVEYSPNATYNASIDYNVPFDVNGNARGRRFGTSAELGVIITPPKLGQLEVYAQAARQQITFGSVSGISPDSVASLDTADAEGNPYNPIYDPNSPNGRRYHFNTPTTVRGEAGLRWGSHIKVNDWLAFRPWGGLAMGRVMSSDYGIYVDSQSVSNDMRGHYYTFQGGAAAVIRDKWQVYLTLGWTGGQPSNNYTLMSGVNYHW